MTMTAIRTARLSDADWKALRAIRLRALQTDPGVFGSSHEREAAYGEEKWRSWLTDADMAVFAILEGGTIIGMTRIAIDKDDPDKRRALLRDSWLERPYRGRGLSSLFYEIRLAWARQHATCDAVAVSHRASNVAAQKAIAKHGFVFTHAAPQLWPDGVKEDRLFYMLEI